MRFLSFSLTGEATTSLGELPKDSITSWDELTEVSFERFLLPSKMLKLPDENNNYCRTDGKLLHEKWLCFLKKIWQCPTYGFLDNWQEDLECCSNKLCGSDNLGKAKVPFYEELPIKGEDYTPIMVPNDASDVNFGCDCSVKVGDVTTSSSNLKVSIKVNPLFSLWLKKKEEKVLWVMQCSNYFTKVYIFYFVYMVEDTMEIFVDDFSIVSDAFKACLDHLRKDFSCLMEKLVLAPFIVALDWSLPFEIMWDASGVASNPLTGQGDTEIPRIAHMVYVG
ncbi:hypothetical protein MTR67_048299 [Solanum verrucosum]|uniref:Uncharacterized protein n=1 Tax=Solanum verrucosum TaxID=315347 RepID=A0AAF0V0K7_SOLVR|nr:hypothetical protein MTR67_048299 [Solanum verrucosum]